MTVRRRRIVAVLAVLAVGILVVGLGAMSLLSRPRRECGPTPEYVNVIKQVALALGMYCDDNHGMMPPHIGIIEGGYYRSGYHSPNWFDWEYAYYPYAIPLKGDKDYDGFDDGSLVVICREPSYGFTPGTKVRERGHYAIIRYSKGMKAVWLPDRRLEAAGALPAWFPSMAERERAAESKERRWPYLVLGIGGGIVVGALSAWLLLRRRRCRSADPAGGGDSGGGAGRGELE